MTAGWNKSPFSPLHRILLARILPRHSLDKAARLAKTQNHQTKAFVA